MKQLFWIILKILLTILMVNGGVQHFLNPDFYLPFVPSFLPSKMLIIYVSGIVEIILGATLLLNKQYAKYGALGIFFLMILFLPIHIWDIFSEKPAIGDHTIALVRLPIQFIFIALSGFIYRRLSLK